MLARSAGTRHRPPPQSFRLDRSVRGGVDLDREGVHAGALVDASCLCPPAFGVALARQRVLVAALLLVSAVILDSSARGRRSRRGSAGVLRTAHQFDGPGEELLFLYLPSLGGLGRAFEPLDLSRRGALRVRRAAHAREKLGRARCTLLAAHDAPPLLTSAGSASGTGKSVAILERVKC